MTIKRYLFLLVTGVIAFVTLAQIILLQSFKIKLEEEIEDRGRRFADKLINMTVESLSADNMLTKKDKIILRSERGDRQVRSTNYFVRVSSNQSSANIEQQSKQVEIEFDILFHQKLSPKKLLRDNDKLPETAAKEIVKKIKSISDEQSVPQEFLVNDLRIELIPSEVPIKLIKQRLYRHLDKASNNEIKLVKNNDNRPKHIPPKHFERGKHKTEAMVNMLFNKVFLIIIATALFSLVLAFWLSRKFTSPLNQLILGFKQLEQGHQNVHVKAHGVGEIQQTIVRFNAMSDKLSQLTAAEKKRQQQQHLSEVTDVTKGLAHSLRNPLHTIGLLLEQLALADLHPDKKTKLISQIQNKITQLNKQISTLLSMNTGEVDRHQTFAILPLVNDIILELKQNQSATSSNIQIDYNIDKNAVFTGSESELRTILHTLIINAFEANLSKNKHGESITINILSQGNRLDIEVIDTGNGIPDELIEQLFNPHVSSKPEGAGMGLYISQRIAQLYYNGLIELKNQHIDGKVTGVKATCTLFSEVI